MNSAKPPADSSTDKKGKVDPLVVLRDQLVAAKDPARSSRLRDFEDFVRRQCKLVLSIGGAPETADLIEKIIT